MRVLSPAHCLEASLSNPARQQSSTLFFYRIPLPQLNLEKVWCAGNRDWGLGDMSSLLPLSEQQRNEESQNQMRVISPNPNPPSAHSYRVKTPRRFSTERWRPLLDVGGRAVLALATGVLSTGRWG